jgi:hypothetical protein
MRTLAVFILLTGSIEWEFFRGFEPLPIPRPGDDVIIPLENARPAMPAEVLHA